MDIYGKFMVLYRKHNVKRKIVFKNVRYIAVFAVYIYIYISRIIFVSLNQFNLSVNTCIVLWNVNNNNI